MPRCNAMTPSAVAELLHSQPTEVNTASLDSFSQYQELLQAAQEADRAGNIIQAVDKYQDLYELGGTEYEDAIVSRLMELYPMGADSRISRNHSDSFRRAMLERVREGTAEEVSASPPIYVLHDVIGRQEASSIRAIAQRRRSLWSRQHPIICFQHGDYTSFPGLSHAWNWRNGSRGCLTQTASSALANSLLMSESLFIYRGQEELLDRLSFERLPELVGLHDSHAKSWQILTYDAQRDGGYAEHTDCMEGEDLLDPTTRMATLLLYLSDDFDGGETEYPRLGLKLKPPVGSAILMYNFGPSWSGRQCDLNALHRSNPVTRGTKVVLQRWHSYAEQPFLAGRPITHQAHHERLPFQSVVSCDFVPGADTNVSCRWYNEEVLAMHRPR